MAVRIEISGEGNPSGPIRVTALVAVRIEIHSFQKQKAGRARHRPCGGEDLNVLILISFCLKYVTALVAVRIEIRWQLFLYPFLNVTALVAVRIEIKALV